VFVQNFAPGWLDRLEILGRAAAATAAGGVRACPEDRV
jgi:hypothetical protein